MLRLENISKTFSIEGRQQVALKPLRLQVEKGEFVTIVGSNGAGKSTLLNIIAGQVNPNCGNIHLDGLDITKLPAFRRAKMISRVFQDPLLGSASELSIAENLLMATLRTERKLLRWGLTKRRLAFFKEVLETLGLGLENRLDSKVKELSGGQRQALALLLATITSPQLLLLDEHTAALDPKTARQILRITGQIVAKEELTVLMVTHNLQDALGQGNRTWLMHEGEIVLDLQGIRRQEMSVEGLIDEFTRARQDAILSDRALLTG